MTGLATPALSTSLTFTLDTSASAPTVALRNDTGASNSDGLTSDGQVTVGAEAGAKVEYSTDNGSTWTSSYSRVEGRNDIQVRQTDVAGNTSTATSFSFVLDSITPEAPTVALTSDTGSSTSDGITRTSTLAIGGTEAGAAVEYSIDPPAGPAGPAQRWSNSFTAVEGANNVYVRQTDAAGNSSSPTSFSFTLDSTAPAAPVIQSFADDSAPTGDGKTTDTTPTLTITAEAGSTVQVYEGATLLGTATETASAGRFEFTTASLNVASHSFTAQSTDAAGNQSAASSAFSIQIESQVLDAPTVALTSDSGLSNSDHITNVGTLVIGAAQGATVEYSTDNGSTWSSSFTAREFRNDILVRQSLPGGQPSAATSFSFTLDTQAASIFTEVVRDNGASPFDRVSNDVNLFLIGVDNPNNLVEYSKDNGVSWAPLTFEFSQQYQNYVTVGFSPGEGVSNLLLRQTDLAGNVGPNGQIRVTLDTVAPTNAAAPIVALANDTGISSTDGITNNNTLTVSGIDEGNYAQFSTDGGAHWSNFYGDQQGPVTVLVRQADIAGNPATATTSFSFTYDTIKPTSAAPTVSLANDTGVSATDALTSNGTLAVSGIDAGNHAVYAVNNSQTWTNSFTPVEGVNNVAVGQADAAGNISDRLGSFSFTFDSTAPAAPTVALTTDSGSSNSDRISKVGTLVVSGTESGATVQYSIDGGTNWSNSFTATEGANAVQVRQSDVAGNPGAAASFNFTLDTTAPAAPVVVSFADDSAPTGDGITTDTTPTLSISAAAGSTVQVFNGATLLGTATETATAGSFTFTTSALAGGTYNFTAKATDAAGNLSGASSAFAITIDAPRPLADIDVASPTFLSSGQGFRIFGSDAGVTTGRSVSSAGDINGDGYDDLIIGDYRSGANNTVTSAGSAIVVFGKAGGITDIDLASGTLVSSGQGFRIFGADAGDQAGRSVGPAGDINGDGYDDIIIGAYRGDGNGNAAADAGEAIIVFGKAGGFTDVDVASPTFVSSGQGFRIFGADAPDNAGFSVASAGDINGDGYDDLIVGAKGGGGAANNKIQAGEAIIVFGKAGGFTDVDVASSTFVSSGQGFRIFGADARDQTGISVASAGDVNGDGYDDIIIGASRGQGPTNTRATAGEAIVVFGKAGGFTDVDIFSANLVSSGQGFRIFGADGGDQAGASVASAGDINGDGYDDLIIGAILGDGANNTNSNSGEAIFVYGGNFASSVIRVGTSANDALTGTGVAETFVGGQGNDTMTSGGGADAMEGGQGDDVFILNGAGFRNISGGSGKDTIVVDGAGISFDFTVIGQSRVDSIEAFDLTGSGNNTLRLNALDVLALSEDTSGGLTRLTVHGDAGDVVDVVDSGWASVGTTTIGANSYSIYQNGNVQIIVDTDVTFG